MSRIQRILNINFNSIKVRLKHIDFSSQVLAHLFQFHKGTIKTARAPDADNNRTDFNSIKVRLKHSGILIGLLISTNFNSIKVRLKRPAFIF